MKQIDFLPQRYRDRGDKRRANVWHLLVVVLLGGTVASAGLFQWKRERDLRRQLNEIRPRHAAATLATQTLAATKSQRQEEEVKAALCAYLEHPWPRTQVLAEVVRPLPPEITLSELRIVHETAKRNGSGDGIAQQLGAGEPDGDRPAEAAADLNQLRRETVTQQTVVHLAGTTTAHTSLHAYVEALAESPLLVRVDLTSLDEATEQPDAPAETKHLRFALRVIVAPHLGSVPADVATDEGTSPPNLSELVTTR